MKPTARLDLILVQVIVIFGLHRTCGTMISRNNSNFDTNHARNKQENQSCLSISLSAQLSIPVLEGHQPLVIPIEATIDPELSSCDTRNAHITLNWGLDWHLYLEFTYENHMALLDSVQIWFNHDIFKETSSQVYLQVPLERSFKCKTGVDVTLRNGKNQSLTLILRNIRADHAIDHSEDSDVVCPGDVEKNQNQLIIISTVLLGILFLILIGVVVFRCRRISEEQKKLLYGETVKCQLRL